MVFRRQVVALLALMPAMAAVGCGAHTVSLDGKNTEPRAAMMTEPGGSSGGDGSGDSGGHDGSNGGSGHDGSGGHGSSGGGNAHGISWPSDDK